jgi:hypothetical protein
MLMSFSGMVSSGVAVATLARVSLQLRSCCPNSCRLRGLFLPSKQLHKETEEVSLVVGSILDFKLVQQVMWIGDVCEGC